MKNYVIREIRMAHCKRGPQRCEKCCEIDIDKICLLEIFPEDYGLSQRRVMAFDHAGEKKRLTFEVVKVFDSADEARSFAQQNHISDVRI